MSKKYTEEQLEGFIINLEWDILNAILNTARLRANGYYVDRQGLLQQICFSEQDGMIDHYLKVAERAAASILKFKELLVSERLSETSKFRIEP